MRVVGRMLVPVDYTTFPFGLLMMECKSEVCMRWTGLFPTSGSDRIHHLHQKRNEKKEAPDVAHKKYSFECGSNT